MYKPPKTLALKVSLAAHLPSRSPVDVDDLRTMGGRGPLKLLNTRTPRKKTNTHRHKNTHATESLMVLEAQHSTSLPLGEKGER